MDSDAGTRPAGGEAVPGAGPVRHRITVTGTVQGVGFRPFVYRLARSLDIKGTVSNTGDGVLIDAEGDQAGLERLRGEIAAGPPPLARIRDLRWERLPLTGFDGFSIESSDAGRAARALLPPDIAMCRACEGDIADRRDRRYRYPFTNCTDCGPRFTITSSLPYDRSSTSMAAFPMCDACRREYDDPLDRRFHAQPAACPACGPRVRLVSTGGEPAGAAPGDDTSRPREIPGWLAAAWSILDGGGIVAVKGLGGFHLACDATSPEAVRELRARKGREHKPLAVMCRDVNVARRYCRIGAEEADLLTSVAAPIVLLDRRGGASRLPSALAPGVSTLGIALPYTPLHRMLMSGPLDVVVMTSGNPSGLPLVKDDGDAVNKLAGIADAMLLHDREIINRCDDSVAAVVDGRVQVYRRARGFVPAPVAVPAGPGDGDGTDVSVLGAGADMKNAFCLLRGGEAFFGPHVGDLDCVEAAASYRESLESVQRLIGISPAVVAHDLHPLYRSTKLAAQLPGRHIGVQHHHAHMVSCLAENGFAGEAVGIILDGTGFGTDGNLWGFEVLTGDARAFRRRYHLAYMPLPGGERAVRNPWMTAAACLSTFCGDRGRGAAARVFTARRAALVGRMLAGRAVPSPRACGCGRLFDAVSALLGVCTTSTYDGQAAVELGELAADARLKWGAGASPAYRFDIGGGVLDPGPLLDGILDDLEQGASREMIAVKFHHAVAAVSVEAACRAAGQAGLKTVALSGGCWQNRYLLSLVRRDLERRGFSVLTHGQVPPGDGGIALGQAMVARHRARSGQAGESAGW